MKSVVKLLICFFAFVNSVFAQEASPAKTRNWAIEVEPSSFVLKGYGVMISRDVTKDNLFSVGLYSASLNVPGWARNNMFSGVSKDATARVGFQIALTARYKFKLSEIPTNPYVGVVGGWEYFDIKEPLLAKTSVSAIVLTPYVGYEIYFFKQFLYINPQLRGVCYVSPQNSSAGRTETMKPFFLLPMVSLGVKL